MGGPTLFHAHSRQPALIAASRRTAWTAFGLWLLLAAAVFGTPPYAAVGARAGGRGLLEERFGFDEAARQAFAAAERPYLDYAWFQVGDAAMVAALAVWTSALIAGAGWTRLVALPLALAGVEATENAALLVAVYAESGGPTAGIIASGVAPVKAVLFAAVILTALAAAVRRRRPGKVRLSIPPETP
ncbi:MAG: hypothetical protein AB1635_21125 [Acidobacteriota bacterium]